jgi:GGDEF domain-containing protein
VKAAAPTLADLEFPAGTLSISVGLACRQGGEDSDPSLSDADVAESLFRAADQALYAAKAAGRNQIHAG